MRHNIITAAAIALILLLSVATNFATTIIRMDLPQLVQQADSIVQGRVESITVQWDSARKLAFTYVTISVDDPLKGERRRTLTIRQLGGQVGALNVSVAGMPKFTPGESVIVFLKEQPGNTFGVVGMNQGKYEIAQDYAVSNISGIDVYNPKTGRIETPAFVNRAPVENLKAKIRELLK